MNKAKFDRMEKSATLFWNEIRPILESQLKAKIHPLEMLQRNELVDAFDQVGVDAFTVNKKGLLQGLSSRMQYSEYAARNPSFTFRYAKWDYRTNDWDYYREYQRKLHAVKNTEEAILYPHYNVESCITGDGVLHWSYIAKTADLMRYIEENLGNRKKVRVWEPDDEKDKRKVVSVVIREYAKANKNLKALVR